MLYLRQPVTATTALERRAAQLGPVAPRAAGRHRPVHLTGGLIGRP